MPFGRSFPNATIDPPMMQNSTDMQAWQETNRLKGTCMWSLGAGFGGRGGMASGSTQRGCDGLGAFT
jgi:hypothetical protein